MSLIQILSLKKFINEIRYWKLNIICINNCFFIPKILFKTQKDLNMFNVQLIKQKTNFWNPEKLFYNCTIVFINEWEFLEMQIHYVFLAEEGSIVCSLSLLELRRFLMNVGSDLLHLPCAMMSQPSICVGWFLGWSPYFLLIRTSFLSSLKTFYEIH